MPPFDPDSVAAALNLEGIQGSAGNPANCSAPATRSVLRYCSEVIQYLTYLDLSKADHLGRWHFPERPCAASVAAEEVAPSAVVEATDLGTESAGSGCW